MRLRKTLKRAKEEAQKRLGGSDESELGTARDPYTQRKARELKQRARDVDGQTVRRAARRAGQEVGGVDASATGSAQRERYEREVNERAERAATMADPIGVDLTPADPHGIDDFARGGAAEERPEDEGAMMGVGLADPNAHEDEAGDGLLDFGSDGDEREDGDWLALDDPEDGEGWF